MSDMLLLVGGSVLFAGLFLFYVFKKTPLLREQWENIKAEQSDREMLKNNLRISLRYTSPFIKAWLKFFIFFVLYSSIFMYIYNLKIMDAEVLLIVILALLLSRQTVLFQNLSKKTNL